MELTNGQRLYVTGLISDIEHRFALAMENEVEECLRLAAEIGQMMRAHVVEASNGQGIVNYVNDIQFNMDSAVEGVKDAKANLERMMKCLTADFERNTEPESDDGSHVVAVCLNEVESMLHDVAFWRAYPDLHDDNVRDLAEDLVVKGNAEMRQYVRHYKNMFGRDLDEDDLKADFMNLVKVLETWRAFNEAAKEET